MVSSFIFAIPLLDHPQNFKNRKPAPSSPKFQSGKNSPSIHSHTSPRLHLALSISLNHKSNRLHLAQSRRLLRLHLSFHIRASISRFTTRIDELGFVCSQNRRLVQEFRQVPASRNQKWLMLVPHHMASDASKKNTTAAAKRGGKAGVCNNVFARSKTHQAKKNNVFLFRAC
ncbi:hypothetical protein LXL04_001912 [Taraxacum kok-saghyz]